MRASPANPRGGGAELKRALADLETAREQRDAAQDALEAARVALANAQAALAQGAAGNPQARAALGATLTERSSELETALKALPETDGESEGRAAARTALNATKAALDALARAVEEAGPAAGPSAADAHTALDRAETAVTAALTAVNTARGLLEDTPDAEASAALLQAQNALLTAQVSLTPVIRAELGTARGDLATARGDLADAQSALGMARAEVARLTREVAAKDTGIRDAEGRAATLKTQLDAANAEVARLEGALAAAVATAASAAAALRTQLAAANAEKDRIQGLLDAEEAAAAMLRTEKAALQTQLDERTAELDRRTVTFGENIVTPFSGPRGSQIVRTPRQPDLTLQFNDGFDPRAGTATIANRAGYVAALASGGTAYAGMEIPDPVAWDDDDDDVKPILGTEASVATTEFPGRGYVLRSGLRAVKAGPANGATADAQAQGGYFPPERLILQGQRDAKGVKPANAVGADARDGLLRATDDNDVLWRAWDATWRASFRFDPEGGANGEGSFVMRFGGGGDGALIFPDLETFVAKRGAGATTSDSGPLTADNRASSDIAIHFGEPSPDPFGERGYHWRLDAPGGLADLERYPAGHATGTEGDPVTTTTATGNHGWYDAAGSTQQTDGSDPLYVTLAGDPLGEPGGFYEALLFNHAGDDAEGEPRYMKYAAYGLFRYMDQGLGYHGADDARSPLNFYTAYKDAPNRLQAFHYGFDAFDNESETAAPLISSMTTDAQQIEATFNGKTSGWFLFANTQDRTAGINQLSNCGSAYNTECATRYIGDMLRMRADVELRACIGGATQCAFSADAGDEVDVNKIAGAITGLEYSPGAGAGWTDRSTAAFPTAERRIAGSFRLSGDIDTSDGSFSGSVGTHGYHSEASLDEVGATGATLTAKRAHTNAVRQMANYWLNPAGSLEGAFYGPTNALEAAASWYATAYHDETSLAGAVGSFGAVCTEGCAAAE